MNTVAHDPGETQLVLVGTNPFVPLYDEAPGPTFYASMRRVDWSLRGAGTAPIVGCPRETVMYGADLSLASWLEREFTRRSRR